MDVSAGGKRGAGRNTDGTVAISGIKPGSARRQQIDLWGFDKRVSVTTGNIAIMFIRQDKYRILRF
jgi:hypothetical protein